MLRKEGACKTVAQLRMSCFSTNDSLRRSATVVTSWIERAKQFKSPLSVVAGFLLRSRETQAERAKSHAREIQQLKKNLERQQRTIREQLAEKSLQIARAQLNDN